jgi:hypothetical protein
MRIVLSAVALVAIATPVSSAPPKSDDSSVPPPVWTFRVSPSAESKPPLRWHLLPEFREQHEGDAASSYLRAMSPEMIGRLGSEEFSETMAASNDWPIEDFRTEKAKSLRSAIASRALAETDRAARADSCNWRLHQRQREDGVSLALPEIQSMRILSRGLSVRTRCLIADGDFPAAVRSLQTQFAAGRHVGADSSNLVQSLVGIAITSMAVRDAVYWIESPNSPNLYWGLTALPTPFVPIRRGMEGERILTDVLLPGYRDALQSKTPPPPIDLQKAVASVKALGVDADPLLGSFLIAAQAEKARKYLIANGWSPAVTAGLPVTTAVFLHEIAVYDEYLDASLKWMAAPAGVAMAGLKEAQADFVKQVRSKHSTFLARLLLPATQSVYFAQLRLDRQIAGLRCVEAIRLHAAASGKLPTSHTEIKIVPWPNDPANDKPFEITPDGDAVKIVASPPYGATHGHAGFQFIVSLAK